MHIALLRVTLEIPGAYSLKDKRRVIRSLRDKIINHGNISVAEIGQQDIWNRSEMAFITVAATKDVAQKRISDIQSQMENGVKWVLEETKMEWL